MKKVNFPILDFAMRSSHCAMNRALCIISLTCILLLTACGQGGNTQTTNNNGESQATETKDEQKTLEEEVLDTLMKDRETLRNIQRDTLAKPVDEITFIDLFYALEDLKIVTDNITSLSLEDPSDTEYYLRLLKSKHEARYLLLKTQYELEYMQSASAARDRDSNVLSAAIHQLSKEQVILGIDQYVNALLEIEAPSNN